MRIAVVVLGSIAQSPRILLHAVSLANRNIDVDLIAYRGGVLPEVITRNNRISFHELGTFQLEGSHGLRRWQYLVYAIVRFIVTISSLFYKLVFKVQKPDLILVQNPPSIPTLVVGMLVARLRSARLAIDWHNYGYSMLGYRLGAAHPLVRLAAIYEGFFGRLGNVNFCVSDAMKQDLAARWNITGAIVLRDRPATVFLAARHEMRQGSISPARNSKVRAILELDTEYPLDRTSIMVSPTSWTADEDFDLLLEALQRYDTFSRTENGSRERQTCHLLVVITGKGPLRASFETKLAAVPLTSVTVLTRWLSESEYVELLALADLGLSLHRSSSGLDLPMKILDLFGAGVPVCAYDYGACIRELVEPEQTGCLFQTAAELGELLVRLCGCTAHGGAALTRMQVLVRAHHTRTWDDEWAAVAAPVLLGVSTQRAPCGDVSPR